MATREIISQLKGTRQILKHNYARCQAVESEVNFLLGSVIGGILGGIFSNIVMRIFFK